MPTEPYADLIARLSLPEKVELLTGATTFTLAPKPEIGLGELRMSDGPTGVRGLKFSGGRVVTLFPNATLLSASWNPAVAYEVGRLLAEEAMIQELHVVLGPTINLHRSVLGGRLFEAYSEDPLLTGVLAAAYVRGLQDLGVAACLKHLIANESETDRNSMDSQLSEKTLRELYLLPFEIALAENPWSIMAAYNDVNGVAATEQVHVNTEIVKGEWAYDGLIMSDWFATKTTVASANGGLDLVMPGPGGPWGDALVAAVEAGEVEESTIDDHLTRLLRLAERVGALGELRTFPTDLPAPESATRQQQLTQLAASGITVLTNNGVLPLRPEGTVAAIGRHAVHTVGMGGGSAKVNPPHQVSVIHGLTALLGDDRVLGVDGVEVRERAVVADGSVLVHPDSGVPGVVIDIYDAEERQLDSRVETTSEALIGFDDDLPGVVARVVLSARTPLRGEVEIGAIGKGDWAITVGDTTVGLELVSGGGIGAEMLSPPSGSRVIEIGDDDLITAILTLAPQDPDDPMPPVANLGLILRPVPDHVPDVLDRAAAAAAKAEVAVVVVGLTEEQETEAVDKSTIALPGEQDALVSAVAAAAQRTVVVVNAATPVLMPWADEVDAIVWAGLPGQEAGHAIAAALLGTIEPAGRLVTSFPAADGAAPAWDVVPTGGALSYDEGTFIGYRGFYAGHAEPPAFWFGHGLGYSTWSYGAPDLIDGAEAPGVSISVTNTGDRTSREVVQVYLAPAEADEPVRLVGWEAVTLEEGASAVVNVTTDARLWRRWDETADAWGQSLSGGELLIARGLSDIRARVSLS